MSNINFLVSIKKFITNIFDTITYILTPLLCAHCKNTIAENKVFCELCRVLITPVVSYELPVTSKVAVTIHALSAYEGPLQGLIINKLNGKIVSSYQLGLLMLSMPLVESKEFDVIVPVPLHWTRYAMRGFNQAEEIAHVLSKKTNKPVVHLITRKKKTVFQSILTSQERIANIEDAFRLNSNASRYAGLRMLIVDDLFTTGITIKAMSKELLKIQPASLTVVVACRVV